MAAISVFLKDWSAVQKWLATINESPSWVAFLLGLILALAITAVYYVTGARLAMSIFYLFPIAYVTWAVSRTTGITISLICVVVWMLADFAAGTTTDTVMFIALNESLRLVVFLVVVFILAELKRTLRREAQSARQDPLTHVANRRAFYELAAIEISRSQRTKEPFTIVFADIDNFKVVNDRYGHLTGDQVLTLTAETMKRSVRAVDIVARFGGDEFLLLLTGTDSETAQRVVERIKDDLSETAKQNGWPIRLSTGVFTYTAPPHSVDEMITRADQLMYSVKQATKNRLTELDK